MKKQKQSTPKEVVTDLLKLSPDHPAQAQLADPENDGRLWVVELQIPPGRFLARSLPEPVDMDALNAEIEVSIQALQTGNPVKSKYVLFIPWCGAHARRVVECLAESIPNPKLPFSPMELFDLEATFRAVQ